jgi:rubrerythrin
MYYNSYLRPAPVTLIADIEKAINGEFAAIACYEQLAKTAPDEETRNRILDIRKDEIRHFQVFSKIFKTLTGRKPSAPAIAEPCPSAYRTGLHFAFKDEQETVDFYREIQEKSNDPYIKEQFGRASADEQNHAVWFLYLLVQGR